MEIIITEKEYNQLLLDQKLYRRLLEFSDCFEVKCSVEGCHAVRLVVPNVEYFCYENCEGMCGCICGDYYVCDNHSDIFDTLLHPDPKYPDEFICNSCLKR